MEQDFPLEESDAAALVASIPDCISSITPHLKDKNLVLTFPELKENRKLKYNKEKVSLLIEELMVNAYKYAINGSTINIFTRISEGYFWLSMKNDVTEHPYGGVPEKYEKLVLEPFFRIRPPDESAAKFERLGFGLGLAVADCVMKKHNGLFIIHDVKDLTHEKERVCVLSEMLFPVM
jgi:signal transduction histidine kinase